MDGGGVRMAKTQSRKTDDTESRVESNQACGFNVYE